MQEIVHQGRDEHGLARARKARHAEPDRRIDQMCGTIRQIVQGDRGFIGQAGEGRWQGGVLSGLWWSRAILKTRRGSNSI